jgi:hypothetical protein
MNTARTFLRTIRRRWLSWLHAGVRLGIACIVVLAFVQTADPRPDDCYRHRLRAEVNGLAFNFAAWEVGALVRKLGYALAAPQDTLGETQRRQLVKDYLAVLRQVNALRTEIVEIYSQRNGQTSVEDATSKEQELARLSDWLKTRQDMVEGILEEQVSTELEAQGFGRWGYVLPPVKIRFTPLPLLLVTSSRAEITRAGDIHLKAGIPLGERQALEMAIDRQFREKRSLVTPIGGLSAYPAMILETDSLVWLADTFAHEWTHHWLIFRPLGSHYNDSSAMTSINETTASIVGREIGRDVILRYYPDLEDMLPSWPEPPSAPPMSGGEVIWPDEAPPDQFDYNREMRVTRSRVDELLMEGRIAEAEAYMEARRLVFVENGYNIRKLNQAYFAFYGSYATSPSTVNPIGGQLEWLRGQRRSLRDFMRTVAAFTTDEDLLDLLRQR